MKTLTITLLSLAGLMLSVSAEQIASDQSKLIQELTERINKQDEEIKRLSCGLNLAATRSKCNELNINAIAKILEKQYKLNDSLDDLFKIKIPYIERTMGNFSAGLSQSFKIHESHQERLKRTEENINSIIFTISEK